MLSRLLYTNRHRDSIWHIIHVKEHIAYITLPPIGWTSALHPKHHRLSWGIFGQNKSLMMKQLIKSERSRPEFMTSIPKHDKKWNYQAPSPRKQNDTKDVRRTRHDSEDDEPKQTPATKCRGNTTMFHSSWHFPTIQRNSLRYANSRPVIWFP